MHFDGSSYRHFGTRSLDKLKEGSRGAGIAKVQVGLARDRRQRFTERSVMYLLGAAPNLVFAFLKGRDREAPHTVTDMIARAERHI